MTDTVTIDRALFEAVVSLAEERTKEAYAGFKYAWGDRARPSDLALFESELALIERAKKKVK